MESHVKNTLSNFYKINLFRFRYHLNKKPFCFRKKNLTNVEKGFNIFKTYFLFPRTLDSSNTTRKTNIMMKCYLINHF